MFKFTNDDPDFWVQLKGLSAGQPLKNRIPNSIGVKTDPEVLLPDFLFYTILYLFQIGAFKPYIIGSVIPHIRYGSIAIVLYNHWLSLHKKTNGAPVAIKSPKGMGYHYENIKG